MHITNMCIFQYKHLLLTREGTVPPQPLATSPILLEILMSHANWGKLISCCWPKFYKHTVGRLLHQQARQHSISFSIKCHSTIFGKESYSQRALMHSKISSLIFLGLQLAHSSLGGGLQLKIDVKVFQQRQDSNKFASPFPLDIYQHEAYSTCFQLLALVVIIAKAIGVKLYIPDNSYQSIQISVMLHLCRHLSLSEQYTKMWNFNLSLNTVEISN